MVASRETFPLLAELLADQQRLDTPVARIAPLRDAWSAGRTPPPDVQLIPLSQPGPGEQYAFEVDLDSCTGCKSCVAACHALNGLDDTETWRDVGLLLSPDGETPFTQTITSACHHCADPACLNGCPVLAYEKNPVTGVVVHLDDQCIGCSYCVLKCPYDVPKYSARLGIVRKCDLCQGRLAAGEAPACAQACPTHAIRVVHVSVPGPAALDRGTRADVANGTKPVVAPFLPGAPDPAYTRPTTRYVTGRTLPARLVAADAATLRPQPPHWPLVIMLTLLPAAVGLAGAAAFRPSGEFTSGGLNLSLASWLIGAAGLGASGFHLGQPLRAWRIFLGWRRSWLSREAMLFGAWFGTATAALFWPQLQPASAIVGALGLACSALIYIDTRRWFWRASQTGPRFTGTALVAGTAVLAPPAAALLLLAKLAWEARSLRGDGISARLQRGPLARPVQLRFALGLAAVALFVFLPGWVALGTLLAGELAERLVFFRAVDAPKMPGSPA